MDVTDLVDLGARLLPRRLRQFIVIAFAATALTHADVVADALSWYATEKYEDVVRTIVDVSGPAPAGRLGS